VLRLAVDLRVVLRLDVPLAPERVARDAAFVAWLKSRFSAVVNLPLSRRAFATNLPSPLCRLCVLLAALPPAWVRSSVSAFWAASSDRFNRLSAAGSLKLVPLRDEDRADLRACGMPPPKTGRRTQPRAYSNKRDCCELAHSDRAHGGAEQLHATLDRRLGHIRVAEGQARRTVAGVAVQ